MVRYDSVSQDARDLHRRGPPGLASDVGDRSGGSGATPSPSTYVAVAERSGAGWSVEVQGLRGPARFTASDLIEAERSARRLIWGYTGADPDDLVLDVGLPGVIADRLWLIAQYHNDMDAELRDAVTELRELGLSTADLDRVLGLLVRQLSVDGESPQTPERPHLHVVGRWGVS